MRYSTMILSLLIIIWLKCNSEVRSLEQRKRYALILNYIKMMKYNVKCL